jgi:hypothetical protein
VKGKSVKTSPKKLRAERDRLRDELREIERDEIVSDLRALLARLAAIDETLNDLTNSPLSI